MTDTEFNPLTATDLELCAELNSRVHTLGQNDQNFAVGMIGNVSRYGRASEKQRLWLEKLYQRTIEPEKKPERVKTAVGDLSRVMALFDKAKARLKKPAIVLMGDEFEVRLSVASDKARQPGTINVATAESFDEARWFGRILTGGQFEASPREKTPSWLLPLLSRFAAEPAKTAAEHGRLTGKCCFCNKPLTTVQSTSVGYGPNCAKNYDLPFPTKAQAQGRKVRVFV
jgi:Family of unknown function (DUF6011)